VSSLGWDEESSAALSDFERALAEAFEKALLRLRDLLEDIEQEFWLFRWPGVDDILEPPPPPPPPPSPVDVLFALISETLTRSSEAGLGAMRFPVGMDDHADSGNTASMAGLGTCAAPCTQPACPAAPVAVTVPGLMGISPFLRDGHHFAVEKNEPAYTPTHDVIEESLLVS
jgi:hypothetical protein